jgi:hypothetical protein
MLFHFLRCNKDHAVLGRDMGNFGASSSCVQLLRRKIQGKYEISESGKGLNVSYRIVRIK